MAEAPDYTPVFLVTGFLGSGKTTLLSRLLQDPGLADTAVLINEFGDVALDHLLVERIDDTMVVLSSGCLCCTVRGELAGAIRDLQSRRARGLVPDFRRLVIETTGLADPLPILSTLAADPVLKHHVRLGAVITTVDAVNGLDQLARQPESVSQVAAADHLVLTKTDLATAEQCDRVLAALQTINPSATMMRASEDMIASELLREPDGRTFSRLRCWPLGEDLPSDARAGHAAAVQSYALAIDEPLDWSLFGLWLSMVLNRHGSQVLRFKALLNVAGSPTPVALHGVQQLVHMPRHLDAWPSEDRRSLLVFIVRGLDPALLARSLRAFGALAEPVLPCR